MLLQKALKLSALLSATNALPTAVPSAGVNILDEVDGQGSFRGKIQVVSNVPVNLDNYFGNGMFLNGAPLYEGEVKVLVTSNCDTSQHDVQSRISLDETAGTITVDVGVEEGAGATMPFLAPSSFDAKWTKDNFWCDQQQFTEPAIAVMAEPTGSTKPATSDGCRICKNPKTGVCDDSQANCFIDPCDVDGACGEGETCEANYCGGCHAICSGGSGITTTPTKPNTPSTLPLDECAPNAGCAAEGSTCTSGEETCCGETYPSMKCECSDMNGSGKLAYLCRVTDACLLPCADQLPEQLPEQLPILPNNVTTTAATAPAATTGATEANKGGDPNNASGGVDTSPAFTQQRCFAASFVVLVVVSLLLPGRENYAQGWMGVGAVAVAAAVLSAGATKKNGIARNNVVERGSAHMRGLQGTCSFNVEILYDGCAQSISVDAPSARVVDVSLDDYKTTDLGDCVSEYDVTLAFPEGNAVELDLQANNIVNTLTAFSDQCAVVAIGRPFIDSSGEMLKSLPIVPDMKEMNTLASVSWSGEIAVEEESISRSDNVTDHDRFLLGEEWTERAIGEHASVASFSAFSIALMTNNAPSDLVEDALKAGMDEIRHARTSFEVASKLVGKPVGPGPLPPSTHKFGDDLTSLALAVAREGCVDETLSAIVADLEVEDISRILEEEGTHDNIYSNIERDTLAWIKKEMQTIAKEESSHAALAWRTLNWVCDIDADACEAVHRNVFDEASLELRFNQRAMNALSEMPVVRDKLNKDWVKLLEAHRLVRSNADINQVKESICGESEDSVNDIPTGVLRGMIC